MFVNTYCRAYDGTTVAMVVLLYVGDAVDNMNYRRVDCSLPDLQVRLYCILELFSTRS